MLPGLKETLARRSKSDRVYLDRSFQTQRCFMGVFTDGVRRHIDNDKALASAQAEYVLHEALTSVCVSVLCNGSSLVSTCVMSFFHFSCAE